MPRFFRPWYAHLRTKVALSKEDKAYLDKVGESDFASELHAKFPEAVFGAKPLYLCEAVYLVRHSAYAEKEEFQ